LRYEAVTLGKWFTQVLLLPNDTIWYQSKCDDGPRLRR